jgi:dTDP-4-dehydrorhamnose reductase
MKAASDPMSSGEGPVWVTGAAGLIGNEVVRLARDGSAGSPVPLPVRGVARADLDLTDFAAVDRLFAVERPSAVIHCAAMSKSPACQRDPEAAWRINHAATAHLAGLAEAIPFLLMSTDLVFDGLKGGYVESDPVNPLGVYAETKVAAETAVLANPHHAVVRTSLNFGRSPGGRSSFNEEMREAWRSGRSLDLFEDEYRSPIAAAETARVLWALVIGRHAGLFHLAGSERLSRVEIGRLVAEWCRREEPNLPTPYRAGSLRNYRGAPRSPDTSMDSGKVERLLDLRLPCFSRWMAG